MNSPLRFTIFGLAIASLSIAAVAKPAKRLTLQRVRELTAPTASAQRAKAYRIEVEGLGRITLSADHPQASLESVREVFSPNGFEPPKPTSVTDHSQPECQPSTPTDFEQINAGWTVRLTAKAQGKLISISGVAEYADVKLVPGGYGAVAGPIYADQADVVLTPNNLDLPKVQTTATRFHLFALPGETYEVTFYRSDKAEKRRITVSAE